MNKTEIFRKDGAVIYVENQTLDSIFSKGMSENQQKYVESVLDNCRFHINRLRSIKESGVKLTQVEKSSLDYFKTELLIVNDLQKKLNSIK